MLSIFEVISKRLAEAWRSSEPSASGRSYRCQCGRPVFFRNSVCLACQTQLGFDVETLQVRAIEPGTPIQTWKAVGDPKSELSWRRCENLDAAGCNWLIPNEDPAVQCRSCRLNRTIPDLTVPDNARCWMLIENAKRRLVAQLLSLGLPVKSKVTEDLEQGVMFDFLRSPPEGPRVLTGHDNGLITLNIEEADDSTREKMRFEMHEPYRTLLGHFRHEIGHYYWDRLIFNTPWLEKFRELFGDEREDYAAALQRNYEQGPAPDWADRHISTYASTHPWEDWAETWAHYLHVVDSLDTALGFGLRGEDVEAEVEPFVAADLYDPKAPDAQRVVRLVNSWVQLTTVLNELARSMGQPDYYPFVMSRSVLKKMHFIQMVVKEARGGTEPVVIAPAK
ncbi:putative zinc-binding metallopeptidase [Anatilimnocola sp. NA78]|uniref:zinc-binding metallopeptidase family protein n=1 Tax=Anatilimnocola sp. NA78 TaxID=3415683 RepID=UPI003CE4FFC8